MSAADAVVVGVGNPYRRDDGIGPAIANAVEALGLPGVRTAALNATTSDLLHVWEGARLAIVVDAVRVEPSQPGRIHRVEWAAARDSDEADGPVVPGSASSTHELSLEQAARLGDLVGLSPARLVVFGVEAADLGHGHGFSPAVDAAMPQLLHLVVADLGLATPGV